MDTCAVCEKHLADFICLCSTPFTRVCNECVGQHVIKPSRGNHSLEPVACSSMLKRLSDIPRYRTRQLAVRFADEALDQNIERMNIFRQSLQNCRTIVDNWLIEKFAILEEVERRIKADIAACQEKTRDMMTKLEVPIDSKLALMVLRTDMQNEDVFTLELTIFQSRVAEADEINSILEDIFQYQVSPSPLIQSASAPPPAPLATLSMRQETDKGLNEEIEELRNSLASSELATADNEKKLTENNTLVETLELEVNRGKEERMRVLAERDEVQTERAKLQREIGEVQREMQQLRDRLAAALQEVQRVNQLLGTAQQDTHMTKLQLEAAQLDTQRAKQQLADVLQESQKTKKELEDTLHQTKQQLETVKQDNQRTKKQLDDTLQRTKQQLETVQQDTQRAKQQLEAAQQDSQRAKKQFEDTLQQTKQQLEAAQQDTQRTKQELATSQRDLQSSRQQLVTTNQDFQGTKQQLASLQCDFQQTKQQLTTALQQTQQLTQQLAVSQQESQQAKQQLAAALEEVHLNVKCDGCEQVPLKGPRWNCQYCPNFDFCQRCFDSKTHAAGHTFRKTSPHDPRLMYDHEVHQRVTCDGCKQFPIKGIRWKCRTCLDFDLCERCIGVNSHANQHQFRRVLPL